jgi:hypothetical protein
VELGLWVRVGKRSPDERDTVKSVHICDEIGAGLAVRAAMLRCRRSQTGSVTTSHELARVDSDVARRADRCRSSVRRLCYGQALDAVMPRPLRRSLAHAPAGQDRPCTAPAAKAVRPVIELGPCECAVALI